MVLSCFTEDPVAELVLLEGFALLDLGLGILPSELGEHSGLVIDLRYFLLERLLKGVGLDDEGEYLP